jgi:predicted metal-binding membrane protein
MTSVERWQQRTTATVSAWVLTCSAAAWWWMYRAGHAPPGFGASPQSMPALGAHHHASAETSTLLSTAEGLLFLAMWTGMVLAMMLPVAIPLVAAHRFITRLSGREGIAATGVFVAGYLLSWVSAGLVALLLVAAKRWSLPEQPGGVWAVAGVGLALTSAGWFQFSSLKTRCLTVCRNPLTFVLTHDFAAGAGIRTLRAGAVNGLYCLGCCWALMLVQLAVGMHNLVWMGALTLLFVAERVLAVGRRMVRPVGVLAIVLGMILMIEPLAHTPLARLAG